MSQTSRSMGFDAAGRHLTGQGLAAPPISAARSRAFRASRAQPPGHRPADAPGGAAAGPVGRVAPDTRPRMKTIDPRPGRWPELLRPDLRTWRLSLVAAATSAAASARKTRR